MSGLFWPVALLVRLWRQIGDLFEPSTERAFWQKRKQRKHPDPLSIHFAPFPTPGHMISMERTEEQQLRICSRR